MNILIIGDVHGRNFWKNAVEKHEKECDKIIFLGDYLDPYPWEKITRKEAINNFDEIINYKIKNKDKVILLLGNHDLPYYDRNFGRATRYDSSNAWHIIEMFKSHRSIFKLAHEEEINGKKYIFTHAGLLYDWCKRHTKLIPEIDINHINLMISNEYGIMSLTEVSRYRGGLHPYGSIVWADLYEMEHETNENLPWDYQIFGHSQQITDPVITKYWACLDCRKAFILDENGKIEEI